MKKFWEFKALSDKKGELYLYGEIATSSWFGDEVTPKSFKADLDALGDIDTLDVYINSPGGDVFAGWALINILNRHKATTTAHNDGLVASIAFDLYQSMDKRVASENCLFMTHNCWTFAMGDRHALRKIADEMEKIDGMLAATTSRKSGKTAEEIRAIQDAESWYTGKEAVDEGFADETEDKPAIAACITPEFFAKYKHPPEALHPSTPQAADEGGFSVGAKPVTKRTVMIFGEEVDEGTRPRDLLDGIDLDAPVYADNGGASQPVADIPAQDAPRTEALKEQRSQFDRIKRKILEA